MLSESHVNEYDSLMVKTTNTRRTRDPEAKLRAIIQAGEKLFAGKGFEHTKMSAIAAEAGVAVGTLYRLFPDKPSLLAALHRKMEEQFIAAMHRGWARGEAYSQRFDYLVECLLDELISVRKTMPLYMMTKNVVGASDHQPGERIMQEIAALYALAVDAGAARAFPDGYQAAIGHALIEGTFRAWVMDPTKARRVVVQKETQELLKRAFQISD